VQVDCKAKQIAELADALERTTHQVKSERLRTSDVEHMLAGEKKLAAKLRDDLESVKKQLSDDKDKLCNALKQNSFLTAHVAGACACMNLSVRQMFMLVADCSQSQ
jgi:uncharacterized phage infection (PIP) family protein YhgE